MSFVDVMVPPLQLFAICALVTVPVAATAHWAESLVLQALLPHPVANPRTGWQRVILVARWVAALGLTIFGVLLMASFGITVIGPPDAGWLDLGLWILGSAVLLLVHAALTVRIAWRGARLRGIDPWAADHKEDEHLWRVMTRYMPLRAWDSVWIIAALAPPIVWVIAQLLQQRPGDGSAESSTERLAVGAVAVCLVVIEVGALVSVDRAQPHLTLARRSVAESEHSSDSEVLSAKSPPDGVLLRSSARRRARRLPASLREQFLASCGRLEEALAVAGLQQNTRPEAAVVLRDAIQHSARITCCLDAFEGVRIVDAWLAKQGLLSLPVSLPRRHRLDPAVRAIEYLTGAVKNLIFLAVTVASFVLLARAGWGAAEFVDRLR